MLATFPPGFPSGDKMATAPHILQEKRECLFQWVSIKSREIYFQKKTRAVFSSYDSNWIPYVFLETFPVVGRFHVLVVLDLGSCSNYSGKLDGTVLGQSEIEEGEHPLEHLDYRGEGWEHRQMNIPLGKRKRGMVSG